MTDESPRPATKNELKWLNNGFDKEALEVLETNYFERAGVSSDPRPPWVFVEAEPDELEALE